MDDSTDQYTLRSPFAHRAGLAWTANLPGVRWPSDSSEDKRRSQLRLWENETQLGPRHALHDAIENEGAGRYSHWNGGLIFSASDGSDPNTNGRRYAVSLGAFTDEVFPAPTVEFFTKHRHSWVAAVPDSVQLADPLGADADEAFRVADGRTRSK